MVAHLPGLFLAELRRTLRLRWSYRLNTVAWLFLWVVALPLLMVTFDSVAEGYGPEQRQASLLGFLMWDWCMAVLGAATGAVAGEAREGTLENVMLVPFSPLLTFSLRVVTSALVSGLQTLILGFILILLLNLQFPITGPAVGLILFTLFGVGGIGLGLGGLALVFKSTENLVGLFSLLALVMTGALVPLERLGVVYEILKVVVPTTWGIAELRGVIVGGTGWETLWMNGTWAGLIVQTVVFVAIGVAVFEHCFLRARRGGDFSTY